MLRAVAILVAALAMIAETPPAGATSLAAYPTTLSVTALRPQPLQKPPAAGSFRLIPQACISTTTSPSPSSQAAAAAAAAAAANSCSGFQLANSPEFPPDGTNSAVFAPATAPVALNTAAIRRYVVGTLQLTNGGLMQPQDVGMPQVTLQGSATVGIKGGSKSLTVPFSFNTSWSLGSPAPANNAGLFVLSSRDKSFEFRTAGLAPDVPDLKMKLKLLGFVADPEQGKQALVLGPWGSSGPPPAGQPGPRVAVKQGAGRQVVQLIGEISRAA